MRSPKYIWVKTPKSKKILALKQHISYICKMKTTSLTILIALSLLACKKEEPEPAQPTQQCNCGTIANDGIDSATNCYWLEIRNECSGNKKKFCFDQDIWTNNFVGDRFCVTNVTSW